MVPLASIEGLDDDVIYELCSVLLQLDNGKKGLIAFANTIHRMNYFARLHLFRSVTIFRQPATREEMSQHICNLASLPLVAQSLRSVLLHSRSRAGESTNIPLGALTYGSSLREFLHSD